ESQGDRDAVPVPARAGVHGAADDGRGIVRAFVRWAKRSVPTITISNPAESRVGTPLRAFAGPTSIMAMAVAAVVMVVMAMIVRVVMVVRMIMVMIMMMQPLARARAARVLAEDERLDGHRHRVGGHPDAAEVDVVEVPQDHAVDHQE